MVDRRSCRHRPLSALALRRQPGGPSSGHGRDHRHTAGRAGPPERTHRSASQRAHHCDVENLCHASWTLVPPSGLYAYGTASDAVRHALIRTCSSPNAPKTHPAMQEVTT
ncbi:hypothetical protein F750_3356 [Streptomyces sp. PAMC 26508]|nr:hypothetical protein F750_3356 [Streptomyces sp. PAMC 26508]